MTRTNYHRMRARQLALLARSACILGMNLPDRHQASQETLRGRRLASLAKVHLGYMRESIEREATPMFLWPQAE